MGLQGKFKVFGLTFFIWKMRNQVVPKNLALNWGSIFRDSLKHLNEYCSPKVQPPHIVSATVTTDTPFDNDVLTLNTDTSWNYDLNRGRIW